jgi:hypothetical protein
MHTRHTTVKWQKQRNRETDRGITSAEQPKILHLNLRLLLLHLHRPEHPPHHNHYGEVPRQVPH